MTWHVKTSFQGHRIEFGDRECYVSFAPDQFGKVSSVGACGYSLKDIRPIYEATAAVLQTLPRPHRFGNRFSDAREDFYALVVRELNRVGYVPARLP